MRSISWSRILKHSDIVGGDIECHEDGASYRGPISRVVLLDTLIVFYREWTARHGHCPSSPPGWVKASKNVSPIAVRAKDSWLYVNEDGTLHFSIDDVGDCIIYPVGTSKLDPAEVEGLVLDPATR